MLRFGDYVSTSSHPRATNDQLSLLFRDVTLQEQLFSEFTCCSPRGNDIRGTESFDFLDQVHVRFNCSVQLQDLFEQVLEQVREHVNKEIGD